MSERKVDRDAWARVLIEIMQAETRGKIAPFARLVGVDPRTVTHWLDRDVNVSEDSVRKVAKGTGRNAMELLIKVGYYQPSDIRPEPRRETDPEIALIMGAPVDEPTRRRMLERLAMWRQRDEARIAELRRQDQERRVADLRWMLDQETPD